MKSQTINNELIKTSLSKASLIECSLRESKNNSLSSNGSLVIRTGEFTGRAINDKYIVRESYSEKVIDWSGNIHQMTEEVFKQIKNDLIEDLNVKNKPLYLSHKSASANPDFALGVNLYTASASHSLFSELIFRDKSAQCPLGVFTIYHSPDFKIDKAKYDTHSTTVIALNFASREILIAGTGYAGEIKKSIFSVLNTLLPDHGVLPMHTGANQNKNGRTSLFFGLSGTGKTTLSTDVDVDIIGDDEHGLCSTGIFNFEGGCYAKTDGLNAEKEPDIFHASNKFGSLLENVVLDPHSNEPQYNDKILTENGRSTYSLESLGHIVKSSTGAIPTNMFFLSADATGVLPAVARLDENQAMYYFLSGYTAKLAGTELGMAGVKETFSHCFGAPFMMRNPKDYGALLKKYLKEFPIRVWLINTGWYGGPYGTGSRYPLSLTRNCIRAIQAADNDQFEYSYKKIFNLRIPNHLNNVDSLFLDPEGLWGDSDSYKKAAQELKDKFEENFLKYN